MSESDEKKQPQARQAITSVCVFCGSSKGKNPAYVENAQALGAELAKQSITLVYGGGNIGLMGAVATACDAANGKLA
jgi:predicted Rossmann-fold nucleotide-binding protein